MKKTLLLVIAALVVPSVAFAATPTPNAKAAPQMTYVVKGTLSNYTAYDSVTPANGTISILVKDASPRGKALKGQTLTFAIDANTAVSLKTGLTTITDGDSGWIRFAAPRNIAPANLAANLQATAAKAVHDMGVKRVPMTTYTINGKLSAYTAYDNVTPANGTVSILVRHAMPHGKSLKGQTLTFAIDAHTKIRLNNGLTTITDGDRGIIKVRAPKKIAKANLAATLQASPAKVVHDQGAPKH